MPGDGQEIVGAEAAGKSIEGGNLQRTAAKSRTLTRCAVQGTYVLHFSQNCWHKGVVHVGIGLAGRAGTANTRDGHLRAALGDFLAGRVVGWVYVVKNPTCFYGKCQTLALDKCIAF